jgi:hypothetical protein
LISTWYHEATAPVPALTPVGLPHARSFCSVIAPSAQNRPPVRARPEDRQSESRQQRDGPWPETFVSRSKSNRRSRFPPAAVRSPQIASPVDAFAWEHSTAPLRDWSRGSGKWRRLRGHTTSSRDDAAASGHCDVRSHAFRREGGEETAVFRFRPLLLANVTSMIQYTTRFRRNIAHQRTRLPSSALRFLTEVQSSLRILNRVRSCP